MNPAPPFLLQPADLGFAGAPRKALVIAFKYLGDVVVLIPALRALRERWPQCELHVLVAEDALPLVRHLPWISRAWGFPRVRGALQLRRSWPMLGALRRERFDVSLDFIGNDRGAWISLGAGARRRFGLAAPRGFVGRRLLYHRALPEAPFDWHESRRHLYFAQYFGARPDADLRLEMHPDPALAAAAARLMPERAVVAHLSTSKPLKEWPVAHWCELADRADAAGVPVVFATGHTPRERALLAELLARRPQSKTFPAFDGLDEYLAVLARARALVSGDTGPMHFAAALGVPTLSIFGPSKVDQWAPIAPTARTLSASDCRCSHNLIACAEPVSCLSRLGVDSVWTELASMLSASPRA